MSKTCAILLAGGVGSRMGAALPKQFLPLRGKQIALYSYELFSSMSEIDQVVVVCDPAYQHYFNPGYFAIPGNRRQDSVFNGLQQVCVDIDYIIIHDTARPFIKTETVKELLNRTKQYGAAACAVPMKSTVKVASNGVVSQTLDRSTLWEIQTPQAMKIELLNKGFEKANRENLTVTDDVSLVELLGERVRLITSTYENIKITTPDDLAYAEFLLERQCAVSN